MIVLTIPYYLLCVTFTSFLSRSREALVDRRCPPPNSWCYAREHVTSHGTRDFSDVIKVSNQWADAGGLSWIVPRTFSEWHERDTSKEESERFQVWQRFGGLLLA